MIRQKHLKITSLESEKSKLSKKRTEKSDISKMAE